MKTIAPVEKFALDKARSLQRNAQKIVNKVLHKPPYVWDYCKPILDEQSGNNHISALLNTNDPFMVARLGSNELGCVRNFLHIKQYRTERSLQKYLRVIVEDQDFYWLEVNRYRIANIAGFFPNTDEMLERFCAEFIKHCQNIDALGIWYRRYEDIFHRVFFPDSALIPLKSIEPYYHSDPWSKKLKDKKVLVVHPFEESIKSQFQNRKLLFPNPDVLPDFDLQTVKAVQSIASNQTQFKTWFDAYEYMCEQIASKDFDVAIIGAGAYGLPLASFVKQIGKQAIHMGGATQILFGIRGKRWDHKAFFQPIFNEHWVRPSASEIPQNHQIVEGGSYW